MANEPVTIPVWPFSDGNGHIPSGPKYYNCDGYFEEQVAKRWMLEIGALESGVSYKLSQLPQGYSGWYSPREGSKHVDRCKQAITAWALL
jgi:hypothetical protein